MNVRPASSASPPVGVGARGLLRAGLALSLLLVVYGSLVPLAGLPQLNEHGREAYQAMASGDHPPHARIDIPWQQPGQ